MDLQPLFARLGGIRPVGADRLAPPTESEIAAFEAELGTRLPIGYRAFLATYGALTFNGASSNNPYIVFRSLNPLPPHISKSGKGLFDAFSGAQRQAHDGYSVRVRTHF